MNAEIWDYSIEMSGNVDLTGFGVEARDGSIGKIDEATHDVGASWLVVDTGPWILGRKVVIPASAIAAVDLDAEHVALALTKDQVKHSPELDELEDAGDPAFRLRVGEYYTALPR